MISLRRLSIPQKVVTIAVIISAAALIVSSGALIGYDYFRIRKDLAASTTTLARIAADQLTAAVSFNDHAAANDILNALRDEPSLVSACVYSGDALFVGYPSGGSTARCPSLLSHGSADTVLQTVIVPIELKGKNIGSVRLQATPAPAYSRLRLKAVAVAFVFLLSAAFAFSLAAGFQRVISEPILNLARIANRVSTNKDYSAEAVRETEDEIGTLVDSFNEMMRQIRNRENALKTYTVQLEAANEELRNAGKMKDEFLATLSHELRTPMNAVFGWVSLLRAKDLGPEKTARALDTIDRNAKAQLQLVDDLLNVSQIVTGKMKIHPQWTDAETIIGVAVDSIQPAAVAKQICIVSDIGNPNEPVYADPERIQQVLWNLLTNAVKFSHPQGEIHIHCGRVDNRFQITVSDRGEGVEPSFIPHLFERFTQADSSRTRKYGGLGLGLAIVRHIVELHGGSVTAQSDGKGRGAAFTVTLPTPPARRSIESQPESQVPSLRGLHVLVVEDDSDTRDMVVETLTGSGAVVTAAASGPEALNIISRQTADVLVSDIGMPEMDGYEFIKRIRTDPSITVRAIPALALTAYATEADKQRSTEAGYQAYLVKPARPVDLVGAVAVLARHSARNS